MVMTAQGVSQNKSEIENCDETEPNVGRAVLSRKHYFFMVDETPCVPVLY